LLDDAGIGDVIEVRHDIVLPFALGVDEPGTLGSDRIAAAAGAWAQGAREAVIVDAGTAVTVDVLKGGVFEGGAIFPGSRLLARSLSDGTAVLPFMPVTSGEAVIPGRGTEAAIRAGIKWGLVGAVTELVRRSSPPGASIWLTGGECEMYAPVLEGDLHIDKDLVLKGLLEIFTLNSG
jgi:type III pantothenate kinase